jgi:hypothetical protein
MDRTSAFAWQPNAALSQASNAAAFMHLLGVDSWEAMVRCGDEDPERFHRALLDHFGFRFYRPYSAVVDETRGPAWASWCVGGTTNVVLNVLDRWRGTPTYDKPLLDWEGEDGAATLHREITRGLPPAAGCGQSALATCALPAQRPRPWSRCLLQPKSAPWRCRRFPAASRRR